MVYRHLFFPASLVFLAATACAYASPFSVYVSGATGADGGVGFSLSGNTGYSIGDFKYDESEQAPDFLHFLSTSFNDSKASFTISNAMAKSVSPLLSTVSADFTVSNPKYTFVVDDTNGTSQTITGYTLSFSAEIMYDPQTGVQYASSASASELLIPPASSIESFSSGVTAKGGPLATVPLPSSASVFGAGLIALAAAAYAAKRKRTAAA